MSPGTPGTPSTAAADAPDERGCSVLHVAVDDLAVAVRLLRHPELTGLPVVVAGGRGVVLSASPRAREAGAHPGAPLGRARRLCPGLTVLARDPGAEQRAWAGVLGLLRSLTPAVEELRPGAACLEVSGAARRLGGPGRIARLVRDAVADEQGLACSVGAGPTRLVAALAAGAAAARPGGGVLLVPRARALGFLHAAPAAALPGVGRRTAELLEQLGLRTAGDVAHTPAATLRRALGGRAGDRLHALAWGREEGPPPAAAPPPASLGAGSAFARDVDDPRAVHRELLRLAVRTAGRARAAVLAGRTVVLRVRFADG
ncbi:DNA polymerase Y family protein, partial [Kineococcus indalonis]|uniref:DNA polymerase Y family protein n=1 Tax=Kineococcus indalonis TaxID=2696566 RepID=UPI00141274B5